MPGGVPTERVGDRFELIDRIGTGGMASVWLARDLTLGRNVAIKRLHPHLAEAPGTAERFTREASTAAALSHSAIVTVYDVGEDDDGPYLVMEHVEGRTLSDELVHRGALPVDEAASIAVACAQALAHAHDRGVIHRDVKPGNVLLGVDGSVKLADFGIAKVAWETEPLTQTTSLLGTASYLSPEQAIGDEATPASDLYSLGVVLYEMLTGSVPFPADSPVASALAHTNRHPDPPGRMRPLPIDLERVVMQCLAKDPDERFPDTRALAYALAQVNKGLSAGDEHPTMPLPPPASRPTLVMTALGGDGPTSSVQDATTKLHGADSSPDGPPSGSRRLTRLIMTGAVVVVALVLVGLLAVWAGNTVGREVDPAAADTTLAQPTTTEPTEATTTTVSVTTTTAVVSGPGSFDEALILLSDELEELQQGREISPRAKRDLEKDVAEMTREWEKDQKPDKARDRLEKFLEEVSEMREDGLITSAAADRLIEAGLGAISLLPEEND